LFRKEFVALEERHQLKLTQSKEEKQDKVPFWISITHVTFLAWTVAHNHAPVLFVGAFLLFLGFYHATKAFQEPLNLKPPVLVGFFLAGLVVHGTLQAWWIAPLLTRVSSDALLLLSAILTTFNDNAEITFLATLIPTLDEQMKYAIVAGAVTGGGLTVIANAPNPLGQSILSKHFQQGISAIGLLKGLLRRLLSWEFAFISFGR
jgi:Na+/H+ antiporter NhaD/arsenite permease-like protein